MTAPKASHCIRPEDIAKEFPCGLPKPHGSHYFRIDRRDIIGGYRCDGKGGIVVPPIDVLTVVPGEWPPLWIPVVVFREDGRPCLCYAPHDEDCNCEVTP